MQPEALEEARNWLTKAERDLKVAEKILVGQEIFPDAAAFHAQQAAEKALKGLLAAHDQPLLKTHDLEVLVGRCEGIEPAFSQFLSAARTLSAYAVEPRYPGGSSEPTESVAREAVHLAREIVQFIRDELFPGRLP